MLRELDDGSLIACGVDATPSMEFPNAEAEYGLITKIDSNGNELWRRTYYHPSAHPDSGSFRPASALYDIKPTLDGGFVSVGKVSPSGGGTDYWILKVDSMGCLVPGCDTLGTSFQEQEKQRNTLRVFPNPAQDQLTIEVNTQNEVDMLSITISDLNGKIWFQRKVDFANQLDLSVESIPNGFYFLHVSQGSQSNCVQKLSIQR